MPLFSRNLTIRSLQSGGLITNYHCTSRCRHCLYCSGPRWPKDFMDRETARRAMETILRLGCASVHIGGGEPFLNPEGLLAVLETARETGMAVDYVETNGSWFVYDRKGTALLEQCRRAGLRTLLISISPFHNEFIPFQRVRNLMEACRETGIRIFPWVDGFRPDLEALGVEKPHDLQAFTEAFGQDYLRRIPRRYWIHYGGRAALFFGEVFGRKPARDVLAANDWPCPEPADTSHFHVDLYGRYIPGLCSGLAVDLRDLGRPLDQDKYPLLSLLFREGIRGLFRLASERYDYRPARDFLNKCDLCLDIRRHLALEVNAPYGELHPRTFYREWRLEP
ncbi:4Fe-4S single cluster domain-containing protein [Desulfacinum infernum DSM 9756]|uniref:4Fe-4S single cluster domain-containing protein n=1 Tax=Desulfacinum infernum DSM 9756 TaxID=1121391 RepID=A0A1M4ZC81_9BACT|nr:radical SAM protein [Desulfacinum infernum]SHF15621.1 4Fe-4S single cluster domain-containing protein [Desulfacinum infernum DSM 9756]